MTAKGDDEKCIRDQFFSGLDLLRKDTILHERYSRWEVVSVLKVNKSIIQKYGAVSPQCCQDMVKNLAKISKAQINVSITGIAGPNGGTKSKPVGLVYIGVKKGKKLLITKNIFNQKTRNAIQKATVKRTLNIVNTLV
jgi:nicotinamide-nucleotide amidase